MRTIVNNRVRGVIAVAFLFCTVAHAAVTPDAKDPTEIMTAVERRDPGDRMMSRIQMRVTSKTNGQRDRVVHTRSRKFAGGTKQQLFFESPADVRNIGLLTIDYDDGSKSDDQWLYLPALHRSTRIHSSDRSGSFMGTDLSYSDMTRKDPSQYQYILLQPSVRVNEEDCWLIESKPVTDKEKKETGYIRTEHWISKSKLVPIQSKSWLADGKKIKYIQFKDYRQVSGLWTAHQMVARTVNGNEVESTTLMNFDGLAYDQPAVKDEDFVEQRLEHGL